MCLRRERKKKKEMNEERMIEYITKAPGIDAFTKLPWTEYTAGEIANNIIAETVRRKHGNKSHANTNRDRKVLADKSSFNNNKSVFNNKRVLADNKKVLTDKTNRPSVTSFSKPKYMVKPHSKKNQS
jgi:hypothetical protein